MPIWRGIASGWLKPSKGGGRRHVPAHSGPGIRFTRADPYSSIELACSQLLDSGMDRLEAGYSSMGQGDLEEPVGLGQGIRMPAFT
jgi:hypothetical protein